ncbi:GntR family transcriptional regulator [Sinomonas flava]|uniref:GntR family transcriptional regulator n=1 Tax=Sinomonas flava TaxID=496857 RepID=A0ABN3BSN9_9MICC
MASELGISRTPVREALLLLSAENLVQLVPNRGALVPPLTPELISNILEVRTVLEAWAVREAVARGVEKETAAAMRECLDEQKRLINGGTFAEFIAADRDFHTRLIRAMHNPVLEQLYESVRARHVVIGVSALERSSHRREEVLAEHTTIVDALESGDVERAEKAVAHHLDATRRMLVI